MPPLPPKTVSSPAAAATHSAMLLGARLELHARDLGARARQRHHQLGPELHAQVLRRVLHHRRQLGRRRDRGEVVHELAPGWARRHGRRDDDAVGSRVACVARERERGVQRLGAHPGEHGDAARHGLDDRLERSRRSRGRQPEDLAREAEAEQALGAALDAEAGDGGLRREVERAVVGERGGDAREDPCPAGEPRAPRLSPAAPADDRRPRSRWR